MAIFSLLNGTFVGLFGIILSAAYCDILWTKHKYLLMAGSMAMILLLQGAVYFVADSFTVRHFYPLITHLPLIIVLVVLSKKWLWSVIAVLTAYLCCQLRRWLALLIVAIYCRTDYHVAVTIYLSAIYGIAHALYFTFYSSSTITIWHNTGMLLRVRLRDPNLYGFLFKRISSDCRIYAICMQRSIFRLRASYFSGKMGTQPIRTNTIQFKSANHASSPGNRKPAAIPAKNASLPP